MHPIDALLRENVANPCKVLSHQDDPARKVFQSRFRGFQAVRVNIQPENQTLRAKQAAEESAVTSVSNRDIGHFPVRGELNPFQQRLC
jgi:hypothetical protein